jgi:hypothetical protein
MRRLRQTVALLLGPLLAAGSSLAPLAVTVSVVVGASVAGAAAGAVPAAAATGSVLILSTSVNGGTASAEARAVPSGYTVTVATPSTWDAMTAAQFKAFSAIIIGDPSTTSCATAVPADALSTAATWGSAVTGNVAVLGTAPALAGTAGSSLLSDAVSYAASGSGTGLYVSLNCEYATAAAGTAVPLLAGVDGGGFTVTGRGSACPDSGTVNTLQADTLPQFNGLAASSLASWSSPACSVQESFPAWPTALSGVAYLSGASPAAFTASDGATGQAYVLAGAAPSAATQALAPSNGGEVLAGATAGGSNPADPGASQATAGDPVNTENGDFTQSGADVSVPTFGPSLDFTRTYDGDLAQLETETRSPGSMGYGWTDNWASSLSTDRPVPGDIYTMDGLGTTTGDGGPAAAGPLDEPGGVFVNASGTYIADTADSRVQEVAAVSGMQWGMSMTAGDAYTIAGSATGAAGASGDGGAATAALLDGPKGVTVSSAGVLYIADAGNNRVQRVTAAGVISTLAGSAAGTPGLSGDKGAASSALLSDPSGLAVGAGTSGDVYIADTGNSRVQEVPAAAGIQWGQPMTAGDIYTITGSSTGTAGHTGDGGAVASALLSAPAGVAVSSGGDLYIADTANNRVQEVPAAAGTQWGQSMLAHDMYTVTGSAAGTAGHAGDGAAAGSALLNAPGAVTWGNGGQLYIADTDNNRVQEAAGTGHTERGTMMTAGDIYTIAGSATGSGGFSGNGGAGTSALLAVPGQAVLDGSGDLLIADTANNRVRQVSASSGTIAALAGNGGTLQQDGDGGPATGGALLSPSGLASDAAGNIYIADTSNERIQEIAASTHSQWGQSMTAGDVYTVAGSSTGQTGTTGDSGPASAALLNGPEAVAADAAGNLYIADAGGLDIREVAATAHTQWGIAMAAGDIYLIAGGGTASPGDGGSATSAKLGQVFGLTVDPAGDLYLADSLNSRIQEVAAAAGTQWGQPMTAGDIYTIAGSTAGTAGHSATAPPPPQRCSAARPASPSTAPGTCTSATPATAASRSSPPSPAPTGGRP